MIGEDYDTSRFELDFEKTTIPYLLESISAEQPDKVFFRFQDVSRTYGEINKAANTLGNSLIDLGFAKGDRVCLMMKNSLEFIHAWFALAKIGAVMVPMNPALRGNLLRYIIHQSDAVGVICDRGLLDRIKLIEEELTEVHTIISVLEDSGQQEGPSFSCTKVVELETLMKGDSSPPSVVVEPWDPMGITFTSGTTGPSKGPLLSHHYYYNCALLSIYYMRHQEEDILYSCLPFFHANASMCSILTGWLCRATFAMGKVFSLTTFWDEIEEYQASHTNVMGSILVLLMKQPEAAKDSSNSLRIVNSVPLIPDSHSFEDRFNVKLIAMYGATETQICVAAPYDEKTKPDSCGKALPTYEVRIFDDFDRECPRGIRGEIVSRAKLPYIQMERYIGMPEETLKAFRNCWYHTGDYGKIDEDGYVYFLDRKKDAIRRRGENISSFEVEEVVNSHPFVTESAAVAIKDEVMTEDEVKVCVILKEGVSLTEEELTLYCKERMAYFMVPRYVEFMKEFPKTPNQKIQKFELRERGLTADTWDRVEAGIKVSR